MNLLNEKIVLAGAVGLGIVMLLISEWLVKLQKKKGIAGMLISLVFIGILGYYIYLVCYVKPALLSAPDRLAPAAPGIVPSPPETAIPLSVILEISGETVTAELGDEIEIRKTALFKIVGVKTPGGREKLKANLVGFIGNPQYNDGQDMGYVISYGKIDKARALDSGRRRYKIEIKSGSDAIGDLYIKFVD